MGPPFAADRCQYTGPPLIQDAEIVSFWTTPLSDVLKCPRLAVLSTYRTPVLPPPAIRLVPGISSGPELERSASLASMALQLLGVNQSTRCRPLAGSSFSALSLKLLTPS